MIRTPLSRSKGTRGQGHQAALITAVLAHQAAAAVGVRTCWPSENAATLPSARLREALRRPRGRRGAGAYRGGRPPTACFDLLNEFIFGLRPTYYLRPKVRPNCLSHLYKNTLCKLGLRAKFVLRPKSDAVLSSRQRVCACSEVMMLISCRQCSSTRRPPI